MTDNYINNKKNLLKIKKERDNYIFGLIFGLFLALTNIFIFLSTPDIKILNLINISFIIVGNIYVLMVTIYPNIINPLHNLIKFITNIIGNILFKIILSIIYLILVIPIGLIIKLKNKKKSINLKTNFIDCNENCDIINYNKGKYKIFSIFKLFTNENYILILPLIIILILIGILLMFVQSNVIAPFIYTLF